MEPKMSRENRAKQFQPFAALKGYLEALRKKEKMIVSKIELSSDSNEELNRKLQQISRNDILSLTYFCENEYLTVSGMVTEIDSTFQYIIIADTKIPFDDIYDITIE